MSPMLRSPSLQAVDGRAVGLDDRECSAPDVIVGPGAFGDGADHELGQDEITGSDVGAQLPGVAGPALRTESCCSRSEPGVGIEPTAYCLQDARSRASRASSCANTAQTRFSRSVWTHGSPWFRGTSRGTAGNLDPITASDDTALTVQWRRSSARRGSAEPLEPVLVR